MSDATHQADWPRLPLDKLVPKERPICYGVLKPGDYSPTGVPLIRITDLETNIIDEAGLCRISSELDIEFTRSRLLGGELLVSIQGTIGRVALVPEALRGANISRTLARIALRDGAHASFYRHWFLSGVGQQTLASSTVGTTRSSLNIGTIRALTVPCPESAEQARIAEVLDTIEEAIEKTDAVLTKMKQLHTGLLRDLLTRGLDERGELRDPLAHVDQFSDSPIGPIPRDWDVRTLAALCSHIGSGATPRGGQEIYTSDGVTFIRSQNVTFEGLLLSDVAFISDRIHRGMLRSEVLAYDVLFNITGASIGRCCPVPPGIEKANVNQHVCIFRVPNATAADAAFLAAVLASPIGQRQLDAMNTHGNRQGVNYQQLGSFVVPWPKAMEREAIAERIKAIEEQKRTEERERAKLVRLRLGLMADLVTGRVRVPETTTAVAA